MPHCRLPSIVLVVTVLGCGTTASHSTTRSTMPSEPRAAARLPDEVVARALLARFDEAYCEADYCLDPYPLWAVTGIAVSADRIALAGPGALLSVFADGAWTTYRAPSVEGDEEPDRVALHVADFTPDGARLIVAGSEGRLYELGSDGLALVRTIEGDEEWEQPVTFAALLVAADDDWFALDAYGAVLRVHAGEVSRHPTETPVDRLISVGPPLEQLMIVSGPFGGLVIEDAFGASTERVFHTDEQFERMGEYSGCGPDSYDERSLAVYERAEELLAEGLSPAEAEARAERETPPRSEDLPPAGVTIPRSGGAAPEIESYLSSTPAGRAILPIVRTPPTPGSGGVVARRGRSVAVAVNEWPTGSVLWARLGARGFVAHAEALGTMGVLDVAGDRLLAVGASGAMASLAPGEEALRYQAANALLASPTAVRLVDNERALVATEQGRLLSIDLHTFEVRELPSPGGVVRAIDAGTSEAYAVGDDGLVIRVRDTGVTRMASGVSVDLTALWVLGERRLVVAGDASVIAILAEGEPRVLPRLSSDRIVELVVEGDEIFARTDDRVTLHVEGDRVQARPGFGGYYPGANALALRFAPSLEGRAFVARTTAVAVAVDGPDAIAPFGALLWDPSHDRFPAEQVLPPGFLYDGGLSSAVFTWEGGNCCDGDYPPTEGEALLEVANMQACDEAYADCSVLTSIDLRHRLLSMANGTAISIVRGTGDCPDLTLRVERMGGGAMRAVSSEVLDCAAGLLAQQDALRARLAALAIDATWEPAAPLVELDEAWGEPSGVGFYLRAARTGIEVVRSDTGNRHATVVLRLPRDVMPSSGLVALRWLTSAVSDEAQGEWTAFEGGGFFWAGTTPSAMADAPEASDDAACERYAVRDADGMTTLRVGPSSRSEAASVLANGTLVHVARREGSWLSIDTPQRGWLFARNVRCIE